MKYVYDGTFSGFLTTVYEAYYHGISSLESVVPQEVGHDLFGDGMSVTTNTGKAEKVADAFFKACGGPAFRWLYRAFLCEDRREDLLLNYIRKGFNLKKDIYASQKQIWVWEILTRARKTGNEAEKWKGILRFSELEEGMLYASVRPTHDVLPLIVRHFQKRLPEEEWAIHDIRRNMAAYYDGTHIEIVRVENPDLHPRHSGAEEEFRNLWRGYWKHMAIEERRNPDLQRSFLPKKYWSCLTEMG